MTVSLKNALQFNIEIPRIASNSFVLTIVNSYICVVKKFYAVILFLVFTLSTIGQNFEMHLCSGSITDISFFNNAQCCCIDSLEGSCEMHVTEESNDLEQAKSEKSCCDSIHQISTGQPTFISRGQIEVKSHDLKSGDICFYRKSIYEKKSTQQENYYYHDPLITIDFNKIFQCFLI
jgi:hypothetical protein